MGELINLNKPAPIADADLPATIARDAEYIAADAAHIAETNPHSQYLRILDSFDTGVLSPIQLAANTWQAVGNNKVFGQQGVGSTWLMQVYIQYVEVDGSAFHYYQYCGSTVLGAIFWQADFLASPGVQILMETHNEANFLCGFRLGIGQARKVEVSPNRAINIVPPGFLRVSGIKLQLNL